MVVTTIKVAVLYQFQLQKVLNVDAGIGTDYSHVVDLHFPAQMKKIVLLGDLVIVLANLEEEIVEGTEDIMLAKTVLLKTKQVLQDLV